MIKVCIGILIGYYASIILMSSVLDMKMIYLIVENANKYGCIKYAYKVMGKSDRQLCEQYSKEYRQNFENFTKGLGFHGQ